MAKAFAYRFDAADRSIVISGDTIRSDDLARLAQGADILAHHTSVEDGGRVAQAAGIGTLVLSHLVPAEDPSITEQMWIDAASRHFRGRVVVGTDLLEL